MEFAQAIAHGRGLDYASEQARRVAEDAKVWAGKVGMGISIAAANTLKAINSPGDMPSDKAREYYLQPENETEHHAALIADIVITALPLAAKAPRAPESAVLRSTRAGEAESGLSLGQQTVVVEEARAAADRASGRTCCAATWAPACQAWRSRKHSDNAENDPGSEPGCPQQH